VTHVRAVVEPGWIEVTGPGLLAVVAVADTHADALAAAAQDGVVGLLDTLASHGLFLAPDFVVAAPLDGGRVRLVLRGAARATLGGGAVVTAAGREPWLDVDVEAVEVGGEVAVGAPEPEVDLVAGGPPPDLPLSAPDDAAGHGPEVQVVLAVVCTAGHHNPPDAGRCRRCGREVPPQQPFPTPRPTLGILRLSTGGVVPLDRGIILGRAPRVDAQVPPDQRPHLVRVGGPDRDISRTHAEVLLDGWAVRVRDLGSTNGTTVTLPGQDPVRLTPTEECGIEPGTVITLAGEVSLTFDVQGEGDVAEAGESGVPADG
jgi:hypothetical protein